MDPSGGSVSTGPNITGGMEPGMNTNIYLDRIQYEKQICSYFPQKHLISFQFFKNAL